MIENLEKFHISFARKLFILLGFTLDDTHWSDVRNFDLKLLFLARLGKNFNPIVVHKILAKTSDIASITRSGVLMLVEMKARLSCRAQFRQQC